MCIISNISYGVSTIFEELLLRRGYFTGGGGVSAVVVVSGSPSFLQGFRPHHMIVIERNIPITSMCSHHHQTIGGVVHVGYVVGEKGHVIGLSKINRIVEHFGRRGAIQEQLTSAIHQALHKTCENNLGVIVTIVATHNCVSCRGVKHRGASMVTTKASGVFRHSGNDARKEYFDSIKINNGGHNI